MNIIVCLDDRNGMLFNHRRQSQDRVLRQRVLEMCSESGSRLLMNAYSGKQFDGDTDSGAVTVSEDFLIKASPGDFCFVETESVQTHAADLEKLIIYRWNRKYPGDFFFDINLDEGWELTKTEEFAGSSHDKITEEIYIKAGL